MSLIEQAPATTSEKTPDQQAQIAKDAEALGKRPVQSTLDIVKAKFAELKKGTAGESQGADQPAVVKADAPVAKEGREADGKFAKSEETKAKEQTANEEKALNAIRRARIKNTFLEKFSDEERIEFGLDLAEQQAKTDKALRERGLKTETREADPAKAGPPQENAADLPKPNSKALAEELGLDEVKGLDAYGQSLVEPLVEQLRASEETNDALAENFGAFALDSVLSRLGAEFPELSVPAVRAEVVATANRLAEGDDDSDDDVMSYVDRIARDAIWRVCRDSIKARRNGTEAANSAAKRLGQPTVGARHGDVPLSKPTTTLERITLAKQLMDSGMSSTQAEAEIKRRLHA